MFYIIIHFDLQRTTKENHGPTIKLDVIEGEGGQQASCLIPKQAVEFPG